MTESVNEFINQSVTNLITEALALEVMPFNAMETGHIAAG